MHPSVLVGQGASEPGVAASPEVVATEAAAAAGRRAPPPLHLRPAFSVLGKGVAAVAAAVRQRVAGQGQAGYGSATRKLEAGGRLGKEFSWRVGAESD